VLYIAHAIWIEFGTADVWKNPMNDCEFCENRHSESGSIFIFIFGLREIWCKKSVHNFVECL
jgi:hypothetical protein